MNIAYEVLISDNKFRWPLQIEHICKSMRKNNNCFFLSFSIATYRHRDQKKICNAQIKLHFDYASIMWDGCCEVHLNILNSLHRRTGKLIIPDPSLSAEQKMSTLEILNPSQQFTDNKRIFMHKVLNNNSPNYLAQLFINHESHYTNSENTFYVPRPRLDSFKTSISFAGASLWNSVLQNIKFCISLPCSKTNLHKYISENKFSSNRDRFV